MKIAIVAVVIACLSAACVEERASDLGRDCAIESCAAGLSCVAMADEQICTSRCASPEAAGTRCGTDPEAYDGYCAFVEDSSVADWHQRTYCMRSCDEAECPIGLNPVEFDFGCACLPT